MFEKIFGKLEGEWKEINLNEEAKRFPEINFANPRECNEWIQRLHKRDNVRYSYGGFLEDRSFIWRDHYNSKGGFFIHEGLDFNVPRGTEVFLFEGGEVVEVIRDTEMHGGWGNAVVFRIPRISKYVIYGHLDKELNVKEGKKYSVGHLIGKIGGPAQNGHYFPHLHIQVMDEEFARQHKKFFDVEGYSAKNSPMLKHLYNPLNFVQ